MMEELCNGLSCLKAKVCLWALELKLSYGTLFKGVS